MLDDLGIKAADTRVRYIKLGEGGKWAAECFERNLLRIDFGLGLHFDVCMAKRWDDLAKPARQAQCICSLSKANREVD